MALKGLGVRKRQMRWRSFAALVAAYALALQTLAVALSYGAHADLAAFDTHVLCLPSGEVPDAPLQPDGNAGHLDCCVLGNSLLGKLFVPPSTQVLAIAQAAIVTHAAPAAEAASLGRTHSPLTARGPPLA